MIGFRIIDEYHICSTAYPLEVVEVMTVDLHHMSAKMEMHTI